MSLQTAVKQFQSALGDAKQNLEQANQAVVFHTGEVARIESVLNAMQGILLPEDFDNGAPTPAKKAGRKGAKPKAHKNDFPKTDAAFWLDLINAKPQKTTEILAAGAKKLGFASTDTEKLATLKQRMPTNLQNLITDGKIKSEGERLNRTYFR